jgi:hypothetical protein
MPLAIGGGGQWPFDEQEVPEILRQALGPPSAARKVGLSIQAQFAAIGGINPAERLPIKARPPLDKA